MSEDTELAPRTAIDDAFAEVQELLADSERAQRRGDYADENGYLPEWFLGKLAELDAAEAVIKAQYQTILKQIATRRNRLWYTKGPDFQAQVNRDLAAQKAHDKRKKSVDYLTGNAGFITTGGRKSVVVKDVIAASLFFDKACPDAVSYSINKTAAKKYYEDTGEVIPGIEIVESPKVESFFPHPPEKIQIDADVAKLLEGETSDE